MFYRKLLEWVFVFIIFISLSGSAVWHYYNLQQDLGKLKLDIAYYTIKRAAFQGRIACIKKEERECDNIWSPFNYIDISHNSISMSYGYPSAFEDGIILLAGLNKKEYSYFYDNDHNLLIYPIDIPDKLKWRCYIKYSQAEFLNDIPEIELFNSSCMLRR